MAGIFYGVGVGPGDPELMTLKAVRMIRENEVILVPGEEAETSVAYKIALGAVPELSSKKVFPVPMPMTKDRKKLEESHDRAADQVEALSAGRKKRGFPYPGGSYGLLYLYLYRKEDQEERI